MFFLIEISLSIFIGEAGVGGAKQQPKKNVAADARNRRALGDIGNLATVRGIEGKPNRPITRFLSLFISLNLILLLFFFSSC